MTIADKDKEEAVSKLLNDFTNIGYRIIATEGTAEAIKKAGIPVDNS